MSDDYTNRSENAAWARLMDLASYLDKKSLEYLRDNDKSETVKTWREAVAWARLNPPPETVALLSEIDELKKENELLKAKMTHYDRWLSGGVYFTADEYKERVDAIHEMASDMEELTECICIDAYKKRGKVDPNCNHRYTESVAKVRKFYSK